MTPGNRTVAQGLIRAIGRFPARIAISDDRHQFTYRDLENYCHGLRPRLTGDAPVAVYGRPSALFGATAGACVALGRPFVHLDPALPDAVLNNVVEALGIQHILLCQAPSPGHHLPQERLISVESKDVTSPRMSDERIEPPSVRPDDPILYVSTSGTTGQPKCIPVTQSAAYLSYEWRDGPLPYQPGTRVGIYIFAVWEMFRPLRHGAEICFPSFDDLMSPRGLFGFITRNRLTEMLFTPSFLAKALDAVGPGEIVPDAPARVILNGEVVGADLIARTRRAMPETEIWNHYSICETHDISVQLITDAPPKGNAASVGVPMPHLSAIVLGDDGSVCPRGTPGRLHFRGDAMLGPGYVGRPEETALRFPTYEIDGSPVRLYDTGDLGYISEDKEVFVLGRAAHMLKLRGHSIQMDDLTGALEEFVAWSQSIPWVQPVSTADDVLVIYYTATLKERAANLAEWGLSADGTVPIPAPLRDALTKVLPAYCIPGYFRRLDEIPVNPVSGKCDFQALPSLNDPCPGPEVTSAAGQICHIAAGLLGCAADDIDMEQSFFSLGGDSLSGVDFLMRLEATFARQLSFELVTNTPLSRLQARLDGQPAQEPIAVLPDAQGVFLTGATGFLGSHILRHLADILPEKQVVYCLVRPREDAALTRFTELLHRTGVPPERAVPIVASLQDPRFGLDDRQYRRLCGNITTVIHCAATVNLAVDRGVLGEWALAGLKPVIRLCKESGADLRFSSSTSVFPETGGPYPEAPGRLTPQITGYGYSKILAERDICAADIPASIIRLPSLYDLAAPNPSDIYEVILKACADAGLTPPSTCFPMLDVWAAAEFICGLSAENRPAQFYNLVPDNLIEPMASGIEPASITDWLGQVDLPTAQMNFLKANTEVFRSDARYNTDRAQAAWQRPGRRGFDELCDPAALLAARNIGPAPEPDFGAGTAILMSPPLKGQRYMPKSG